MGFARDRLLTTSGWVCLWSAVALLLFVAFGPTEAINIFGYQIAFGIIALGVSASSLFAWAERFDKQ